MNGRQKRTATRSLRGLPADCDDSADDERDEPTNKEIAEKLGVSETYIYRIKKDGTPNREFAKKLASLSGKKPNFYLRSPRKRGRPAIELPYPFAAFLREAYKEAGRDDSCRKLIYELYICRMPGQPRTFESLETFTGYLQTANVPIDHAHMLWRRFKVWRMRRAVEDAAFGVELGGEFSDDDMRALLLLLSD